MENLKSQQTNPNPSSLMNPFLGQLVVIRTVDRQVTVQSRLNHVEDNFGGLGNLILEGQDGIMVLRHDTVQTVAFLRRPEEVKKGS